MPQTKADERVPRAMVHKRILDAAAERPEASMRNLADGIPGASVDLVEQVLDEYGDPAGEETAPTESSEGQSKGEPELSEVAAEETSDPSSEPDVEEFSEKQRATLRAVYESPTATQRELGEVLGVTAATVSNRLSDIAGFAWEDRQGFVAGLFGPPVLSDGHGQPQADIPPDVEYRLEAVERQLDTIDSGTEAGVLTPELAHKVVHACMDSDQFSDDEELEVIRALFGDTTPNQQR